MTGNTSKSSELLNTDLTSFKDAKPPFNSNALNNATMNSLTLQPMGTAYAATMLSIMGALSIVAMYIYYLVLKMSKRDRSILNCLLPDFALTALVGGPAVYILFFIIMTLSDLSKEVIGTWFCHVASVFLYVWIYKVLVFSLLVALLRYLYVVHNERIKHYGLPRIERIFLILSWAVPIGLMILQLALRTGRDNRPILNRCYGWSSEPSLVGEPSSKDWFYNFGLHSCIFNNYGMANRFAEYGLRILCWIRAGANFLLFSNLVEAVFYYRIHVHLKT